MADEIKGRCPECKGIVVWKRVGETLFDMKTQEEMEIVKCSKCGYKAVRPLL